MPRSVQRCRGARVPRRCPAPMGNLDPRSEGRTRTTSRTRRSLSTSRPAPGLVHDRAAARCARWRRSGDLRPPPGRPRRQPAVAHRRRQRAQRRAGRGRRLAPGGADPPRGPPNSKRASVSISSTSGQRYLDGRIVVPAGDRVAPPRSTGSATRPRSSRHVRPQRSCRASSRITPAGMLPIGSRSTTPALSTPCPSRKIVALTWNVSPFAPSQVARPHSTAGSTQDRDSSITWLRYRGG